VKPLAITTAGGVIFTFEILWLLLNQSVSKRKSKNEQEAQGRAIFSGRPVGRILILGRLKIVPI
jgi:hypothetical protein